MNSHEGYVSEQSPFGQRPIARTSFHKLPGTRGATPLALRRGQARANIQTNWSRRVGNRIRSPVLLCRMLSRGPQRAQRQTAQQRGNNPRKIVLCAWRSRCCDKTRLHISLSTYVGRRLDGGDPRVVRRGLFRSDRQARSLVSNRNRALTLFACARPRCGRQTNQEATVPR